MRKCYKEINNTKKLYRPKMNIFTEKEGTIIAGEKKRKS